jgi:hypothetical protein
LIRDRCRRAGWWHDGIYRIYSVSIGSAKAENNFAPYTRSLFYYLSIVEHMHNLIDAQKAIQSVDRRDRRGECGVCGRTIGEGEEKRREERRINVEVSSRRILLRQSCISGLIVKQLETIQCD